ncbi:MAG: hypothetical protein R3E68_21330 [Burkholderiaceae bacterium]
MTPTDAPAAPVPPPVARDPARGGARPPGTMPWLATILAALLLNGLLSFENVWPTPLVKPDHRLAPEFVLLGSCCWP